MWAGPRQCCHSHNSNPAPSLLPFLIFSCWGEHPTSVQEYVVRFRSHFGSSIAHTCSVLNQFCWLAIGVLTASQHLAGQMWNVVDSDGSDVDVEPRDKRPRHASGSAAAQAPDVVHEAAAATAGPSPTQTRRFSAFDYGTSCWWTRPLRAGLAAGLGDKFSRVQLRPFSVATGCSGTEAPLHAFGANAKQT